MLILTRSVLNIHFVFASAPFTGSNVDIQLNSMPRSNTNS